VDTLHKVIKARNEQIQQLRIALKRYGSHDGGCPAIPQWNRKTQGWDRGDCTCGYEEALNEPEERVRGAGPDQRE
jgi:hypothetical protein